MSITSTVVNTSYQNRLVAFSDPVLRRAVKDRQADQAILEKQLLDRTETCSLPTTNAIRERLPSLKSAELKKQLNEQFYNADVMLAAICVVDSIIYTSPYIGGSSLHTERIRKWIQQLRQIGDPSVEGIAMIANFNQTSDMFILKVAQNPASDTLPHELLIGLWGTNNLRALVPNFMYVFGGFRCLPPIIENKNVVSWCSTSGTAKDVTYVIYENIAPAVAFNQYVRTSSAEAFISGYCQVMYALRTAHNIVDYTHFDLHPGNVLMRTIKHDGPTFEIPYETEKGKTEYLSATVIATIIDFGFGHIQVNGRHYGKFEYEVYSILPDQSFILYDAYRLLLGCALEAYSAKNIAVVNVIRPIVRFFNVYETLEEILTNQHKVGYALPAISQVLNIKFDDYLSFIRSSVKVPFYNGTDANLLQCGDECLRFSASIDKLGLNTYRAPTNIFDFYDAWITNPSRKNKLVESFNYNRALATFQSDLAKQISSMQRLIYGLRAVNLNRSDINYIMRPAVLTLYRSFINRLSELKYIESDIQQKITIIGKVSPLFNDSGRDIKLTAWYDKNLAPYKIFWGEARTVALESDRYLDTVVVTPQARLFINKDPKLGWYVNERRYIVY